MPVKEQQQPDETLQMSLYRAANKAATDAVVRYSELRGADAERVARYAVHDAEPKLKAAFIAGILGTSKTEAAGLAAGALTMLALNLVVAGNVVRRGGPVVRVAAGATAVGHVAFFWYSRARQRRIRNAVAVRATP